MTLSVRSGRVYDARAVGRILGLPTAGGPVPRLGPDETAVYYGGWDLPTLRDCPAGKARMWQTQDWYRCYGWTAAPGYYRVLLPAPDSDRRSWYHQVRQLRALGPAWKPAPVCVAATALLVHLRETGCSLLQEDWCRCAEVLPGDARPVLAVSDGRVAVQSYAAALPTSYLGLAAVWKY